MYVTALSMLSHQLTHRWSFPHNLELAHGPRWLASDEERVVARRELRVCEELTCPLTSLPQLTVLLLAVMDHHRYGNTGRWSPQLRKRI